MKRKFNLINILTLLVIMMIFVISGGIFLTLLAFGLFGLSRILIFLHLAEFTFNAGFYDNLFYYGSYILLGYFLIYCIEYVMDMLKKKLHPNPYLQGMTFHLITYTMIVFLFYFIVHVHFSHIHIEYWVLMIIFAFLYMCKEIFYPDSENLYQNRK
ncbi:SepA family multidrug efflux transporter [Staphylococcus hyicus]|nr:SepA family multidrug efflux transporter [Staphylococcus hyicus]MDP4449066.1 SepA family multidrug efflux transporter [Staphylococcus hyicus]MDP4463102.1 SepA family multidrug efflux transporter [Staphylococcus hyicus]NJI00941.1 SepA family multidrug efflux transporter [Staphylococcus hyicus]NJI31928.1 SepA family multidrug efflux transporter [Staphylococcus hyicus]